jgi:hypothetical protein
MEYSFFDLDRSVEIAIEDRCPKATIS